MEAQFLTSDLHDVLDLDSSVSSHPIVQEVSHPDQITELFDRQVTKVNEFICDIFLRNVCLFIFFSNLFMITENQMFHFAQ